MKYYILTIIEVNESISLLYSLRGYASKFCRMELILSFSKTYVIVYLSKVVVTPVPYPPVDAERVTGLLFLRPLSATKVML